MVTKEPGWYKQMLLNIHQTSGDEVFIEGTYLPTPYRHMYVSHITTCTYPISSHVPTPYHNMYLPHITSCTYPISPHVPNPYHHMYLHHMYLHVPNITTCTYSIHSHSCDVGSLASRKEPFWSYPTLWMITGWRDTLKGRNEYFPRPMSR